jgi:hypothetical protein
MENVGVDHGGGDVLVSEEFLDGADVVATAQKVGSKGVAQGVWGGGLWEIGGSGRVLNGALEERFAEV